MAPPTEDAQPPAPSAALHETPQLGSTLDARALPSPNRPAAARHYLVVFEADSTRMWSIPPLGDSVIGRGETADLRLDDHAISRSHVRLSVLPHGVRVSDLESQNGTLINDERLVGSRMLQSGDVITVGAVVLVFHADARAGISQGVLEASAFRLRLEQELERAADFHRQVGIAALNLGPGADRARAAFALEGVLRRLDVASFLSGDLLVLLFPEASLAVADRLASRALRALASSCPQMRGGLAGYPSDGPDADTLLAGARDAAAGAQVGAMRQAAASFRVLELGTAKALIADPVMVRLYLLAERLAKSDLPVVVYGETGSGKELLASSVHHFSPRRSGRLVALNCAALHESLIESELFGHTRGAFTGAVGERVGLLEAAHGGTVFLDELGELTLPIQAKLLRALENKRITRLGETEERPIDIRLVAATHRDLTAEVKAGRFREDLYFRLSGASLVVPPLRDRLRELPMLARTFLEQACVKLGRAPLEASAGAMAALAALPWPGNVRELKNTMEYFAAMVTEPSLEAFHVAERFAPPAEATAASDDSPAVMPSSFRSLPEEVRELEKMRIEQSLKATDWNQTRAAELIGMPLRTFVTKLKLYEISRARATSEH